MKGDNTLRASWNWCWVGGAVTCFLLGCALGGLGRTTSLPVASVPQEDCSLGDGEHFANPEGRVEETDPSTAQAIASADSGPRSVARAVAILGRGAEVARKQEWSESEVSKLNEVLSRAPQPFPSDVPDRFRPAGFRKVLDESIDQCELELKVLAVDCDEYPCIAWMDSQEARLDMGACPSWQNAYKEDTCMRLEPIPLPDGGEVMLAAIMPLPDQPVQRKVAISRMEQRCQASAERLASSLRR